MPAEKSSYVFSQKPAPVANRNKFREPILDFSRSNIMADPRVVRGNTYAALVRPDSEESELSRGTSAISQRFQARARRTRQQKQPGIVSSHYREEQIPNHEFLEELTGPITTHTAIDPDDMEQGDEDTVPFVPKPSGKDMGTWIQETDLFEFDLNVEPLLEVLIGKGMEQGVLEVLAEEDVKVLEERNLRWEQQRDSVHVEAQILLSEKQRQIQEVQRRINQASDKALNDKVEVRRWGARDAARSYLDDCRDTVLERLQVSGHFYDPVVNQINTAFMPWLLDKVSIHLTEAKQGRQSVEKVLEKAIGKLMDIQAEREAERAAARAEVERLRKEEEAERLRLEEEIRLRLEEEKKAREAALAAAMAEGNEGDEGDKEE